MTRKIYVALNTQIAHYHIQESRAAVLLQQEAFVPIDPVNRPLCAQNLKSVALPIPGIIGVPPKIGQSLDVPTLSSPIFKWALVRMDPMNVPDEFKVRSFAYS